MNRCLQGARLPEWMTKGNTTLIQKDPSKGTAPNNYRSITRLPMMRKILTINGRDLFFANNLRVVPWGAERILQRIQRHSRVTLHRSTHPKWKQDQTGKNLAMAWIDYEKANDMVPQSWIINRLKMYKISHEVINFMWKPWKPGEWNWQIK